MTEIKGDFPPVIFESPNGRWAVTGSTWIAIGPDVTLDQVRDMWVNTSLRYKKMPSVNTLPKKQLSVVVQSSTNPSITYTIEYNGHSWSCTCTGFGFRRKCRHIEAQKKLIENQ